MIRAAGRVADTIVLRQSKADDVYGLTRDAISFSDDVQGEPFRVLLRAGFGARGRCA